MVFGILLGVAAAPTLYWYASTDPQILWQSGGATALFIAVFGAIGYTTRRDLSVIIRFAFFALIALLIFGIVLIFIHIPHGSLIYAIIGLVIFAALTMGDFQRLRRSKDISLGAADGRVDLPRRAERVLVLPADLRRRPGLSLRRRAAIDVRPEVR